MNSNDDHSAFRAEVADITPLIQDRILPARPQRRKIHRMALEPEPSQEPSPYSDLFEPLIPIFDYYCHPDLPDNQFRRFQRRRDQVDAWLDLHGRNIEQSRRLIARFIQQARLHKQPLIGILHGKGQGILRERLRCWLPQDPAVLAFDCAKTRQGGQGAMIVLLRGL